MTPRRNSSPAAKSAPLKDAERGIRIQKAMARAGVASRRDCEAMVEAGRVHVNGEPVRDLPAWVDPQEDLIELDGEPIGKPPRRKSGQRKFTYLMVHKPRRVISTNDDPRGRKRVIDLVDPKTLPPGARLFPVGRLDADSTGLILLTDDGELTHRLTHPRYEVAKRYRVSVRGKLTEEDAARLREGLFLGEKRKNGKSDKRATRAAMEQVRILGVTTDRGQGGGKRGEGGRTDLSITLREGRNREIRRLLARLGFKVRRLKREAIGPVKLKGVAVGQWRRLTPTEIGMLKKAAGLGQPSR